MVAIKVVYFCERESICKLADDGKRSALRKNKKHDPCILYSLRNCSKGCTHGNSNISTMMIASMSHGHLTIKQLDGPSWSLIFI